MGQPKQPLCAEKQRLQEDRLGQQPWRQWGPYLSDRQWGTVREDYSADGNAWDYFSQDQARGRAYRWGEDGLAGFSDDQQRLCLALALWNGRDPFLKERLFGLTNGQGNHGEDVKELYYYLDATPTHSWLRMLYKYPQAEFPYARLVEENRRRTREEPEFELLDTGVFDEDRYFDVFVEYAKVDPLDILMQITVHNRGPEEALIHIVPLLWFRNTWSWKGTTRKPRLARVGPATVEAHYAGSARYLFHAEGEPALLFCDNDTNVVHLYGAHEGPAYPRDAFHTCIVQGSQAAVNPDQVGTRAAAHYTRTIPPGGSTHVRVRLSGNPSEEPFVAFEEIRTRRQQEADEFYAELQAGLHDSDARAVQRQALAGMIWSKQLYYYDITEWLKGDPAQPAPPPQRRRGRNADWGHLNTSEILSMPDKWEYPWFAAWDLAFHTIPLALVDPEFAKSQLVILTREWYMHANGQLPAYEWSFGDANPPVHAWAAWRVFQIDRRQRGDCGDLAFLERVYHKLLLEFTWWVNRKDPRGNNVFQGGFLGLDNIGVFDRSAPLPTGGCLTQADATSWMAMYSLNLMRIALELALHNPVYEDIATKFFEHFLSIAQAMTNIGGDGDGMGLWDEEDLFYYDALHLPDGRMLELRVRSMVGLIPLFAVETLEPELLARLPEFSRRLGWVLKHRPELAALVSRWQEPGRGERRLLSLLRGHRMKRLLKRMLDETEFLSDHGVRSLSKQHRDQPYHFPAGGMTHTITYIPGDSDSGLFGGNSNWRGPIWFPVNFLIIESLQKFHHYYGDDFKVECPTGSGRSHTINEIAEELTRRLTGLFLRSPDGRRPVFGHREKLQSDPHFRDYLLFYEYFHGDTGEGLGASHQTGWTGLVAKLLLPRRPEPAQPCLPPSTARSAERMASAPPLTTSQG